MQITGTSIQQVSLAFLCNNIIPQKILTNFSHKHAHAMVSVVRQFY